MYSSWLCLTAGLPNQWPFCSSQPTTLLLLVWLLRALHPQLFKCLLRIPVKGHLAKTQLSQEATAAPRPATENPFAIANYPDKPFSLTRPLPLTTSIGCDHGRNLEAKPHLEHVKRIITRNYAAERAGIMPVRKPALN